METYLFVITGKIFFISVLLLTVYISNSEQQLFKNIFFENDKRPFCTTDMDINKINKRIDGGSAADKDSLRFAVFVKIFYEGGYYSCGATLITERHVISAAHCFHPETEKVTDIVLSVGDYDLCTFKEVKSYIRRVKWIRFHYGFNEIILDNDIAIIELQESVPLGKELRAAILPPQDAQLPPETVCTAWGWGQNSFYMLFNTLKQVDVVLTSRIYCQHFYEEVITKNMICADGKFYHGNTCKLVFT